MLEAMPICRTLLAHLVNCARAFALDNAGNNIAARMATMAITTSNSIKVKPWLRTPFFVKLRFAVMQCS
jgi:hypothetical protein